MVSERVKIFSRACVAVIAAAALLGVGAKADDTEIYRTNPALANERAQILIIFDDSGSMSTVIEGTRPPYDPSNTTYTYDGTNKHPSNRIYWSAGDSSTPPDADSSDYFETGSNRCASSLVPLQDPGFTFVRAARWFPGGLIEFCIPGTTVCIDIPGGSAGWQPLTFIDPTPSHVECQEDVISGDPSNPGAANGFPQSTSVDGDEYGPTIDSGFTWDNSYTFYSAHYMDYWHDASLRDDRTRLDIAQSVITDIITANPTIDFGLALFNENSGDDSSDTYDGGRIVQALESDLTEAERDSKRTALVNAINATTANGFTPLCETTMEVYRYLAGTGVVYGGEKHPTLDVVSQDANAESPAGTYDSPLSTCNTFVVLMTDGLPTFDSDANAAIKQLPDPDIATCETYLTDEFTGGTQVSKENCLPELADYMTTNDLDGDSSNGTQSVTRMFTVGFQLADEAGPLMVDTATKGRGKYISAENPDQLDAAFKEIILSILDDETTFTSPAVAVNTFTRTQSRNEVYFAMFQPNERVDWPGNIKRLKVDFEGADVVLVDENGDPAIDSISGEILGSAVTAWGSTAPDGPDVTSGGVGAVLAARDPATRVIYSNTGTNGAFENFDETNMTASAFDPTWTESDLHTFFGVSNAAEFLLALEWGRGYETVDDGTGTPVRQTRDWILADMLHSRPLVVNYGARGSATVDNPDLRIVVGTNAGFLHMFDNDNGAEDWSFFAKELAPILDIRRVNAVDDNHYYGIDSPPIVYTKDLNMDGTIDSTAGDKAYVYVGLRRGGRIIYALDISNPDSPSLLWQRDETDTGFAELGQTWSVPVVAKIPGYFDNDGVAKPVLIFGAGYDDNKDSAGLASPDSMGRGLLIVDAVTGDLVWSVTPAANSATNLQETSLLDSVAAGVSILDSNGDGLTDRVYFADTGGQIWRVDLPGNALPDVNQNTWRIVKLADMNGGTRATDRRFFNAPDVVRTAYAGAAFDAILIGSGDRTNPNDIDDPNDPNLVAVDNQFYMIRDKATNPYFTEEPLPSSSECTAAEPSDFRCYLPLDPNDLYDVTDNDIELGTEAEQSAAEAALIAADGWRLDLEANGEKALASSITIAGQVFFTTFSPESGAANICEPIPGAGRLYVVDLATAAGVIDFDNNGNTDRAWIIGALLPDTPSPHFGEDGQIRLLLPPGSGGGGEVISPFLTGGSVPKPRGNYWFREEY